MRNMGFYVQIACLWEVTARKPGNVHRYRDFPGLGYLDFIQSAVAIAPVMNKAEHCPLGETVLEAIQVTRAMTKTNTNLGIVLLLAPLCSIGRDASLEGNLENFLDRPSVEDSKKIYTAINLAAAGGMGKVERQDLREEPTLPFRQIMKLAADRDMIARQYGNGFQEVLGFGQEALLKGVDLFGTLEGGIIHCHLQYLAHFPDSLITRKLGTDIAGKVMNLARSLFHPGWESDKDRSMKISALDQWLCEDHRRNPGTTADLVTASLFVALRERKIKLDGSIPWSNG